MWLFSVVFACILLTISWRCLRSRAIRPAVSSAALALGLGIFPLLWMASRISVLGGPLQFFHGLSPLRLHGGTPELDLSKAWHRAAYQPLYVAWQAPGLLLAVWGSCALLLRTVTPGRRVATTSLLGFILLVELQTLLFGTGDNWRFRQALVVLVPFTVLVGAGLSDLIGARRSRSRGTRMPAAEGFLGFEEWVLSSHAGIDVMVVAVDQQTGWLKALTADGDIRHFVTSVRPRDPVELQLMAKVGPWMLLSRDPRAWSALPQDIGVPR